MAYMSQEKKKELAPKIKAVLKKYGMKGTLSVRHYSGLVLNIKEGALDVIGNYVKVSNPERIVGEHHEVNTFWIEDHYEGEVRNFLMEIKDAMNGEGTDDANFDNSDMSTDYFSVGWYIYINVGQYNKPYKLAA